MAGSGFARRRAATNGVSKGLRIAARNLLVLLAGLAAALASTEAHADPTAAPAPVAPAAAKPAQPAAPTPPAPVSPTCNENVVESLSAADMGLQITADPHTRWQPPGGEVRFTVKPMPTLADGSQVVGCLSKQGGKFETRPLRIVAVDGSAVTFGLKIPSTDDWSVNKSFELLFLGKAANSTKLFGFKNEYFTTSRFVAGGVTAAAMLAFWSLLFVLAHFRGVKGDFILRIVGNRNGYASLSQTQILIWTFVIGAGAVYVMVLSGNLLDVPAPALGLLGISALTTLGAQLPTPSGSAGASNSAPPAVAGLSVLSLGDTGAVLHWYASNGSDEVQYIVRQSSNGGAAWTESSPTRDTFYVVDGLTAGVAYSFQVIAANAQGRSIPQSPLVITPPAAAASAPSTPALPAPTTSADTSAVTVNFPAAAQGDFLVQYSKPGEPWLNWPDPVPASKGSLTISRLDQDTDYAFRAALAVGGQWSGWSAPASVRTSQRTPRWADLVVLDGSKEVDVTRVQMLLFTVVAASFVALKILDENTIPEIPNGILELIGISNGVYLTAKFIPGGR